MFVWEGVTYYLAGDVVDTTSSAVRELSLDGGSFSLGYASLARETLNQEGVRKMWKHLKFNHPGEPTKFGIPRGSLEPSLWGRAGGHRQPYCPASGEHRPDGVAHHRSRRDKSRTACYAALFI